MTNSFKHSMHMYRRLFRLYIYIHHWWTYAGSYRLFWRLQACSDMYICVKTKTDFCLPDFRGKGVVLIWIVSFVEIATSSQFASVSALLLLLRIEMRKKQQIIPPAPPSSISALLLLFIEMHK